MNSEYQTPEHDLQRRDEVPTASYPNPRLGSMAKAGAQDSDGREPKAVILMERIFRMDGIVNRLVTLRDRITDGNVPMLHPAEGPCVADKAPSITRVLNEGPEILQAQNNQMMDLLSQIESELF